MTMVLSRCFVILNHTGVATRFVLKIIMLTAIMWSYNEQDGLQVEQCHTRYKQPFLLTAL